LTTLLGSPAFDLQRRQIPSKWLKPHLREQRLRDFGTVEAERLFNDFADEKPRAKSQLKHVKGFLSGAFRYAVRMGTIRFYPMRETVLPKNVKPPEETYAYSLAEMERVATRAYATSVCRLGCEICACKTYQLTRKSSTDKKARDKRGLLIVRGLAGVAARQRNCYRPDSAR